MKERHPHFAFTSTSSSSKFLAISWPSAGASKTPPPPPPRRKTPGGRGEPEGRAVPHTHTHTLALFLTNTLSSLSLFLSFTHTLFRTHISFLPSSSHTQFPLFCSFTFTHTHTHTDTHSHAILPDEGRPPGVPESGGAYISQGALLWDCEGHGLGSPKSHPSFPLISERTSRNFPGKKGKKNQGQLS